MTGQPKCLHVYTYEFRWTVDYTRWERVRKGFAIYDLATAERLPF
jgi:hypothetical protein